MVANVKHKLIHYITLGTLSYFGITAGFSQVNQSDSPLFFGASVYYGKFQVHTKSLYPYNGTHPFGLELEISQLLLNERIRETFGTYIKWGAGLNYVNFDHPNLGYAISGLAYIEPFIKVHGQWRFSLKAGCGTAFMSHPYDPEDNQKNLTYSTHLAFPLFGGGSVYYFFNKQWAMKATASFQHISNGGIQQPNLGINYPVIAIGVEHTNKYYSIPPKQTLRRYNKAKRSDILLGYSLKEDTTNTNDINVITLHLNHSWQVSRINALSLCLMTEYEQLPDTQKAIDQWSIAPFFGNEFILGKLYFGQQIGIYALRGYQAPNLMVQNYYLRFRIQSNLITGINLKAHGRVADYLSLQFGVAF